MGRKKNNYTKKCVTCEIEFNPGKHKQTLNCSDVCFKVYREKTKSSRMIATFKAIQDKYGVNHPSKIVGFSIKSKQTKLEKYGDENYNNREKAKTTNIEKYGNTSSMGNKTVMQKSKQTKLEKYGDENYNNREKAKTTSIEKYGFTHHLQNEDILSKMKNTNIDKYGVEYSVLLDQSKENLQKYNQEKYNSNFYFSSEEYLNKTREEKLKQIEKTLNENQLSFDTSKYLKLRIKDDKGIKYIHYEILCQKCNNTFLSTLTNKIPICRVCYPIACNSIIEVELRDFLNKESINFISNNKNIIKPFELDFYLEQYNIAFEINGNYYHSELGGDKTKYYHLLKTKMCFEKDIKLIHIFEDEWYAKKDIVKSRILNFINQTKKKIYARKCIVKEITNEEKNNFLDNNHIQGKSIDKVRLGLFFENEMVSAMSFSSIRRVTGNTKKNIDEFELIRFANKINTNVIGGFSKLLNYFIKTKTPKKIISYADIRWSGLNHENTVYSKNGFKFLDYTKPNYFYVNKKDYLKRFHRFSMRKDILVKTFNETNILKSEWQIAMKNGFDRIWDCGNMKFEITF